jgi:hypothetical protein
METGLTGFSTDSGLNIFKCADSPIHPPLGDIKILSMLIYMMGLFQLHEGVLHQMDIIRSKIFWGGDEEKFKYHMVKWENICLPKDFWGGGWKN